MEWIGRIEKDGNHLATLDASGKWHSDNTLLAKILNDQYDPREPGRVNPPLPFGEAVVSAAAVAVGGKAVFARPHHPPEEGVLY